MKSDDRCRACSQNPFSIVVFAGSNPDVQTQYLCTTCFAHIDIFGYTAFPYSYIDSEPDGTIIGKKDEFISKAYQLKKDIFAYQMQIRKEANQVRKLYERLFLDLLETLTATQDKIMSAINDSEAIELDHLNFVCVDLENLKTRTNLTKENAYLAEMFNNQGNEKRTFMSPHQDLEKVVAALKNFPLPIISLSTSEEFRDTDVSLNARLIEDSTLIMPIDTRNTLVMDFAKSHPTRKVVSCTNFHHRMQACWCKVEDCFYVYTGGVYKGEPVAWTDFISTVNCDTPVIQRFEGKAMQVPRHRHAMICHNRTIYVFGGMWTERGLNTHGLGVEMMRQSEKWEQSFWQGAGDMPQVFDPTVTVLKGVIYLAGKNRGIYKFDTNTLRCDFVPVLRFIDLQIAENSVDEEIVQSQADMRFPLPKQSSNSQILAWKSQVVILQHDTMYSFTPGDKVELRKKRISTTRPWYSPFPAVMKGSKGYFMLEPFETDQTQTGDVWCFDFIKKDVSLVSFNKPK